MLRSSPQGSCAWGFLYRREEVRRAFELFVLPERMLPSDIEKQHIRNWQELRKFFVDAAHYRTTITHEEFSFKLSGMERLLLDRLAPRPIESLDAIDKILKEGEVCISDGLAARAVEEFSRTLTAYEYFFEKCPSAAWIGPLLAQGRFKQPRGLERHGNTIRFPFWPESQYLVRVATDDQEAAARALETIPQTDNQRVSLALR